MKRPLQQKLKQMWCIAATVMLAVTSICAPAHAGANIAPVVLEVGHTGRAAIRLTNTGDEPMTYQLTPLKWDVADNQDVLEPTNDFIASPPSFTLGPRQTREIRVGFRSPQRMPIERAYRLVVEELPSNVETTEGLNLQVKMRYVLPVYIAPAASPSDEVVWSVRRNGNAVIVRADNRGNRRARIEVIGFNTDGASPGQPTHAASAREWVLAQSWREWKVEVPSGVPLNTLLVRNNPNGEFTSVPFSQ